MTLIPPYGRQTLTFDPSPNLQISRQNIIIGGIWKKELCWEFCNVHVNVLLKFFFVIF